MGGFSIPVKTITSNAPINSGLEINRKTEITVKVENQRDGQLNIEPDRLEYYAEGIELWLNGSSHFYPWHCVVSIHISRYKVESSDEPKTDV